MEEGSIRGGTTFEEELNESVQMASVWVKIDNSLEEAEKEAKDLLVSSRNN